MGDVTGKAMFTQVALHQSAIVAADILGEDAYLPLLRAAIQKDLGINLPESSSHAVA